MDDVVFIGDWVKDKVLGSGSFGIVVLWKHSKTEEKLAIKTCKWSNELTEKHRERWTKEVEMLQNCVNPNIVGTKSLPPEFVKGLDRANPSRLPILCMEFCKGGDLRHILNKPESCTGLQELQVRQVLNDISNAIKFLHNNKITHRDLKPENIVMSILDKPQSNRTVLYKLIDLGYAKEIDSKSVCASFVGTLQYLAPEILYSKTYSNSVDYWSFGLLAFEIITGTRPFLPFMAPVQWMPYVKKKTRENICIFETFHGDIEHSNEIFAENFITTPLKTSLEKWLQVVLEWDPKVRGRDTPSKVTFDLPSEDKDAASKIMAFDLLNHALEKKVITVFAVSSLSTFSYEIGKDTTIFNLKKWIFKDTKTPLEDQILIPRLNHKPTNNEDKVEKYWLECHKIMLFFYNKSLLFQDNVDAIVPKAVQRCLEHPKAIYSFKNCNTLYRHGFYFIQKEIKAFELLIDSLCVRSESLKNESKQLLLLHNNIDKNLCQLLAKLETITKFVDVGKEHIKKLKENGTGTNCLGGFEKSFKEADDFIEKCKKIQTAWSQLTIRLQSAARRSNELDAGEINSIYKNKYNFHNIYTAMYRAFIDYKHNEWENKGKDRQCNDVTKICYDCLKLRSKLILEMPHEPVVLKIIDLTTEFSKTTEIIKNADSNIEKLNETFSTVMDDLSDCIWSTISILSSDADNLADLPYSVVSFQKREFKIGEPVSNHCMNNTNRNDDEKLKSLIEESIKIRQTQNELTKKLFSQKSLFDQTSFDFSFLNQD